MVSAVTCDREVGTWEGRRCKEPTWCKIIVERVSKMRKKSNFFPSHFVKLQIIKNRFIFWGIDDLITFWRLLLPPLHHCTGPWQPPPGFQHHWVDLDWQDGREGQKGQEGQSGLEGQNIQKALDFQDGQDFPDVWGLIRFCCFDSMINRIWLTWGLGRSRSW